MDTNEAPALALCPRCGGSKELGKTIHAVDFGPSLVIIRNVPAMVCDHCGEEWIGSETAGKLEQLTQDATKRGEQVAIIAM